MSDTESLVKAASLNPIQIAFEVLVQELNAQICNRRRNVKSILKDLEVHAAFDAWEEAVEGPDKALAWDVYDRLRNEHKDAGRTLTVVNKDIAATATALSALARIDQL